MTTYLLDSNILIHLLHRRNDVVQKLEKVGVRNCCISEISLMELYYGAECSSNVLKNITVVDEMAGWLKTFSITNVIREACRQKAMLKKKGLLIEDNDIIIGSTAIVNGCVLVTENVSHMSRLNGVEIENWVQR